MSYKNLNNDHNHSLLDDDLIETDENPYTETNPQTGPQTGPIQPQIPIDGSKSHMFQINFYRKYFDLNTDEFLVKIKNAINPLNKESAPVHDSTNDDIATELYGFIWITGSLIFLMFVSATGSNLLANWLHKSKKHKNYQYDFDLLTLSISLFYGYNILVPLGLYAITTWVFKFPQRLSLSKLVSIYGYTNILWLPITVVNFLIVLLISNEKHHTLLNVLEWIIVILSGAVTGLSNLSKISPVLERNCMVVYENDVEKSKRLHLGLVGILAFAHLLFTVTVKVSFFGIKV